MSDLHRTKYYKQNEGLIKEMAIKYELPTSIVEKIISHQFEFVKNIMNRKENESIVIKGLGRFRVTRKKWILELQNRKKREATQNILEKLNEDGLSRTYEIQDNMNEQTYSSDT